MRVRVLLNPRAGGGSAARRLPEITRQLGRMGVVHEVAATERPGDAARLARAAFADGVDCIAVVGGDGTLNEVCQAYLDEDGRPVQGSDLAIFPSGTGGDFRRTFQLELDTERAVERLTRSPPRAVDLGVLSLTADSGQVVRRAFVNITSFGIGGLTDRIVNASPKWLGGRATFLLGALRAMLVYQNSPVSVVVDGSPFYSGPVLNVVLANAKYFGGGMLVAPDADPSDGLFDVIVFGDLTRMRGVGLSSKIYKGAHLGERDVLTTRGRIVEARPLSTRGEVLIDMDGETPGRLPLKAELLPAALRFRI
jgi:diacylglycerol kinase (ATP)